MPYLRIAAALVVLAPLALGAQQPAPTPAPADTACLARAGADSAAVRRCAEAAARPGELWLRPRVRGERLTLERPAPLSRLGSMRLEREAAVRVAQAQADSIRREALRRAEDAFRAGANERLGWGPLPTAPGAPNAAPGAGQLAIERQAQADAAAAAAAAADSLAIPPGLRSAPTAADRAMDIFGDYADLGLVLNSRLETKVERNKNERCTNQEVLSPAFNCAGSFQPQFDFQFNVRTGGVVADRIHVNVDYDSQREFDASNNINVYYEGKSDELIERLEVGNVFFTPPSSRFITGGIPSGNYGLQAKGQLGPMRFSGIVAQQKGNRVNGRTFDVGGDGTLQTVTTDLEDFRFEGRRFFWVVDPRKFPGYPRFDILNQSQLQQLRNSLPASQRPATVRLYRARLDAPPPNQNGPQFQLIQAPARFTQQQENIIYQLLTPGIDYYIDPSQLWITLVQPVQANTERLVVAYAPESGTPDPEVTGTPDTENVPGRRTAILLFAPEILATDSAFFKEIRSVYRLGGEDLRRESVSLRIGTQAGGGQEVPTAGTAQTYLQMLGLAQSTNSATFDVDNRLWPRPGDPVQSAIGGRALIRDRYLVLPNLRPFAAADSGLIQPGNVVSDSIYRLETRDFSTQRRPPARYFMRATFLAQGGGDVGSLMLGSVQVTPRSERLVIDGVLLRRDVDYEVDYELGRVNFLRPDTLFRTRRQVNVQYEENPLFAAAPTTVLGLASQLPFQNGQLNFVAISQNQRTTFNRPPLGFEPASALVAGVSGNFTFDAAPISRFLERIPTVGAVGASAISVAGEFATSRPQPNPAGVAYVESFEGEGGITIPMAEAAWQLSSAPPPIEGTTALQRAGPVVSAATAQALFDTTRAASLTWQSTGISIGRAALTREFALEQFTLANIDPQVRLTGNGQLTAEQVLWLSLYPRNVGALQPVFDQAGNLARIDNYWTFRGQPDGPRWRSMRTVLSPTGIDLSRAEYLEFWALVDTSVATRADGRNPVLVIDIGDLSEQTVAFVPDTAYERREGDRVVRREFGGRQLSRYDEIDTERDSLTRQFDAQRNDVGLPSDRADSIVVVDGTRQDPAGVRGIVRNYEVCRVTVATSFFIGEGPTNCTVGNSRLDEEDINLDRTLFAGPEDATRFVVDLNDRANWSRSGFAHDVSRERADGTREVVKMQWQLIRVPLASPDQAIGNPVLRRARAMRVTLVSGPGTDTLTFTQTVLARMRFLGSPWLKRNEDLLTGLAGETETVAGSWQIAGIVGTQDSTGRLVYQPPPGVVDAPETRQQDQQNQIVQINERSIRILAGGASLVPDKGEGVPLGARAEAYFRFPEGQKNFMGYRELRVWAKGRHSRDGNEVVNSPGFRGGIGQGTDLEFFIKVGRDPNNFYMFRRDVSAGITQADWTDVVVRFNTLYELRAQVQNDFLGNVVEGRGRSSCTIEDVRLFGTRFESLADVRDLGPNDPFFACRKADGGTYVAFTESPNNSAPNLAQVQELAVGMVRTRVTGGGATGPTILANDTLEVWADDIRLTSVVNDAGYAGEFSFALNAGDVGRFSIAASRRDANFRQLAENPSYITDNSVAFSSMVRIDRFVPGMSGWAVPVTVTQSRSGQDPFFLQQQDLLGEGITGLRTPRAVASRYSASIRRLTPVDAPLIGALVDNLALDAAWSSGDSRGNYSTSGTKAFDVNATYAVQARARTLAMPGVITGIVDRLPRFLRETEAVRSLRQARFRWNPNNIRFNSQVGRSESRATNFIKPADVPGDLSDPGRTITALTSLWRNVAGVDIRPFGALTGNFNFNSLRDLRRYASDTLTALENVGVIADGERSGLFGLDLGLERERSTAFGVAFQPVVTQWLRPRADITTSFSYLRDPNTRQFATRTGLIPSDSAIDYLQRGYLVTIPRRLNNSQVISAGTTLDLGRMLLGSNTSATRLSTWRRLLSDVIEPIDLAYTRSLSSGFDGTALSPRPSYQLGLGRLGNFLSQNGQLAANTLTSNSLQLRGALSLPFGLSLQPEMRRSYDRSYFRTGDSIPRHQWRENETEVLPRVALGWNYRPGVALVAKVVSNISATAGIEPSVSRGFAPGLLPDTTDDERLRTEQRAYPLRASVTWAFLGDLTTTGSYRWQESEEVRPGGRVNGDGSDVGVQVSRVIRLPKSWNLSEQVVTSMSWQQTATRRYLPGATSGSVAANQANNGRTAFNFNADTQLAENLLGSLVVSRVVNYDNVTNRRFSQLVATAVFQLSFQAGEIR